MKEHEDGNQKAAGMCKHDNFLSRCHFCKEEGLQAVQDPKDLLLSAEEEAAIEQQEGEVKRIHRRDGKQEIVVLGVEHTSHVERVQPIIDEITSYNPDIVFVEGEGIEARFPDKTMNEILAMSPQEVLEQQEQAYTYWLAAKQGIEVRSWDLPVGGEITATLELLNDCGEPKHGIDDAIEWHVVYAMRKVYEADMIPTVEIIYELIRQGVPNAIAILNLTPNMIGKAVERATGRSIEEYAQRAGNDRLKEADQAFVTDFSGPAKNAFLRDMNVVRDRHAMDVLQKAKDDGFLRVMVTAGRSHAYTWEKVIQTIYPD